jgi:hypothetical protein
VGNRRAVGDKTPKRMKSMLDYGQNKLALRAAKVKIVTTDFFIGVFFALFWAIWPTNT